MARSPSAPSKDMRLLDLYSASVADQVAALLDAFAAVAPGCFDASRLGSAKPGAPLPGAPVIGWGTGTTGSGAASGITPPVAVAPLWPGSGPKGTTALEAAGVQVRGGACVVLALPRCLLQDFATATAKCLCKSLMLLHVAW
jgi:hypothetical protein